MQGKQKLILIADDDKEDIELLEEAIASLEPQTKIHAVTSGKMALSYLETKTNGELPSLIVLDYNMQDMNGAQVLEQICNQPRFQKIPKIVWSTSNAEEYKKECMEKGATAYFVKPFTNRDLENQAKEMLDMCVPKTSL